MIPAVFLGLDKVRLSFDARTGMGKIGHTLERVAIE